MMKRIFALVLLSVLTATSSLATAQIFMGPGSQQKAEKAAKKDRKASAKRSKKQLQAMKKSEKAQRKSAKRKR